MTDDGDRRPATDGTSLTAVADLFASLLLREIDAALVTSLTGSGAREQLAGMGLVVPEADDGEALDRLAAEYFESFVKPLEGAPPIQSLAEGDAFEGPPADAMRAIAEAVGVTYDAAAARGAPVDHLGSQLAMWSAILRRDSRAADEFRDRHLRWAVPHLRRRGEDSFYGRLAAVVADFIDTL